MRTRPAQSGQNIPAPVLGTMVFLVLGLGMPALICLAVPESAYPGWAGAGLIAAISGLRFAWVVASRERHLVEMVIWLFIYGFLGIAPMVQLRMGVDPDTTPGLHHEYDFTTVGIILAGMAALFVGSELGGVQQKTATPEIKVVSHSGLENQISPRRLKVLTFGALFFAVYYVSRLGVSVIVGSRNQLEAARGVAWPDVTLSAIVGGAAGMTLLVASIGQIIEFRHRKRLGQRPPFLLLAITVATLLFIVNPISGARYGVGTVYLGLLAALGFYSTLRKYRAVSITALVGLFFLFPLAATFRRTTAAVIEIQSPLKSLLSGDFDSFAQINNAVVFTEQIGFVAGRQLLGVVLFWLPRPLWSNKPIDTGILLGRFRGYGFTNLSAPLWAEFWINGGWFLLIAGMLTIGFLARRWDKRLHLQINEFGVPSVLGCAIPFYFLIILRGSLLQAMATLAVILVCSWFVTSGLHDRLPRLLISEKQKQRAAISGVGP